MNRAQIIQESENQDRELGEQHRPAQDHYTGEDCENCGRSRVELLKNGKEVCEKCHWNQSEHKYDSYCLNKRC